MGRGRLSGGSLPDPITFRLGEDIEGLVENHRRELRAGGGRKVLKASSCMVCSLLRLWGQMD